MKLSFQLQRYLPWFAGVAILAPLPILIRLMLHHAILVPFYDEFALVPVIQKMNDHTLTFWDLMAQHNEHRIFFPRLLMISMAAISKWKISWEIVTNLVLAILSFGFLLKLLWQTFTDRPILRWALAVLFSWIFFSPSQWNNWLWGWQIEWFLNVLGLLVTLTMLSSRRPLTKTRLGLATAGATVANYSLANGVLSWVGGLIVLFVRGEKAVWKWAWTILALLIATPYYYHYLNPNPGSITYFLHHPVGFVKYVFIYLGNPLSGNPRHAGIAGIILAVAFVTACGYLWLRHRTVLPRLAPWLSLAMYAAVSAAMGGVGRLNLGTAQALSSRYITISLLFLLATIVVGIIALEHALPRRPELFRAATVIGLVVISVLIIAGYRTGIKNAQNLTGSLAGYQQCIYTVQSASNPCLTKAYPSTQYAFQQIQYLRKIHWAGF